MGSSQSKLFLCITDIVQIHYRWLPCWKAVKHKLYIHLCSVHSVSGVYIESFSYWLFVAAIYIAIIVCCCYLHCRYCLSNISSSPNIILNFCEQIWHFKESSIRPKKTTNYIVSYIIHVITKPHPFSMFNSNQ